MDEDARKLRRENFMLNFGCLAHKNSLPARPVEIFQREHAPAGFKPALYYRRSMRNGRGFTQMWSLKVGAALRAAILSEIEIPQGWLWALWNSVFHHFHARWRPSKAHEKHL